jgi:hypothetical protein
MVQIDPNDLKIIGDTYNKLGGISDKYRLDYSKVLLTIYTPVTSGILYLSTILHFKGGEEKVTFLVITTSSALIVISALIERFGYYLISRSQNDKYINHVRKTGKHFDKPLLGEKWQSTLVESQIFVMTALLTINVISVVLFVFQKVLS